jgi:hypothetical protein
MRQERNKTRSLGSIGQYGGHSSLKRRRPSMEMPKCPLIDARRRPRRLSAESTGNPGGACGRFRGWVDAAQLASACRVSRMPAKPSPSSSQVPAGAYLAQTSP